MCSGSKATTKQSGTSTYTPTAQASGVYTDVLNRATSAADTPYNPAMNKTVADLNATQQQGFDAVAANQGAWTCLLYTSPSPRDGLLSRMPSSA